jgi:transcriptional/translational regulatory protein YebC/TACO1
LKKGYIVVDKATKSEEELFELAIEVELTTYETTKTTSKLLRTGRFRRRFKCCENCWHRTLVAEVEMVPQNHIKLEGADARNVEADGSARRSR